MTHQTHIVSDHDRFPDELDLWLTAYRRPRRRPATPALVVAWCVYATVLATILFVMPPLLRSVG